MQGPWVHRCPLRIAVLVPCHNEAATIGKVVADFRTALPTADVYVFDNNSSDDTSACAQQAGASVCTVVLQGKGNVIRRMFADIEADIYVMVDGDDTYTAADAPALVAALVKRGLDMVVGARVSDEHAAYRRGHRFGNVLLTKCVAMLFGRTFTDMLSGYRVFSRRYVKSLPVHSGGFEIETELTVHALELRMPVAEQTTVYKARPEGSESKLNTYRDGLRIVMTIVRLFRSERPLAFFSLGAGICAGASLLLGEPLIATYLQTGLVPRFPTAILCAALMLIAAVLLTCGVVLDLITLGRIEAKQFAYLAVPALSAKATAAVGHSVRGAGAGMSGDAAVSN